MAQKTIWELKIFRGNIDSILGDEDVSSVLQASYNDLNNDIKRKWFDPLNLSDAWDQTKLDETELHNLYCYHALFYLYRYMANNIEDDTFVTDRDYFEKQFKDEFSFWVTKGFPYEDATNVVSDREYKLKRV